MREWLRLLKNHWRRVVLRAHKDRRSMLALMVALAAFIYVVGEGYLLLTNPGAIVMLVLGSVVAWRIQRSSRKEDESFPTLLSPAVVSHAADTRTPDEVMTYFADKVERLAVLIARAKSEAYLKAHVLPENSEPIARRMIWERLKNSVAGTHMEEWERDLHLRPDGTWSTDEIARVMIRQSELEALSYATGTVRGLRPLEDIHVWETSSIRETLATLARPPGSSPLPADLRSARDLATAFYGHCLSEQMHRGTIPGFVDKEERSFLLNLSLNREDQNTGVLIGIQLISEISNADLTLAAAGSWARADTLNRVLAWIQGSTDRYVLEAIGDKRETPEAQAGS